MKAYSWNSLRCLVLNPSRASSSFIVTVTLSFQCDLECFLATGMSVGSRNAFANLSNLPNKMLMRDRAEFIPPPASLSKQCVSTFLRFCLCHFIRTSKFNGPAKPAGGLENKRGRPKNLSWTNKTHKPSSY